MHDRGDVQINEIHMNDMAADALTNAVAGEKHVQFLKKIGLGK